MTGQGRRTAHAPARQYVVRPCPRNWFRTRSVSSADGAVATARGVGEPASEGREIEHRPVRLHP
ncbi:hypothetical protein [Promicromonospora sp. NPDC090134]|uniref:hypothetical protein n=1 Tax=Promicromonospora sp. NPDC090134 TaxID=3364408 RepID=UPI00381F98EC